FVQRLVDVAVCGSEHESRPSEPGCHPKRAANPNTQKAKKPPCPIVNPDLKLKRTSRRPADKMRCLIGKEYMRYEPEEDHADVQYQGIEKQEVNNSAAGPWQPAKYKVQQWRQHAQERDG